LEYSVDYKLYKMTGDAGSHPCAYVCDSGHVYVETTVNGETVASCRVCKKSLSTDQTICIDDLTCTNPDYPTKYIDENTNTMQCTFEAKACKGTIPPHGYMPENYQYM
jgi:hypothetical protein